MSEITLPTIEHMQVPDTCIIPTLWLDAKLNVFKTKSYYGLL